MPRSIWADKELPIYPTTFQIENLDEVRKAKKEKFQSFLNLPTSGVWNKAALAARAEHEKDGKDYKGFLDYNTANRESFWEDYTRGIFAQNTANIKYTADRISYLFRSDKYKDTILDLNPDQREALEEGVGLTGWNILDQWSGISHFREDITDLMTHTSPEGWNPKDAVELLIERDPERAAALIRKLGSVEALYSLTEDSINPVQFFYKLADAARKTEIYKSIQDFYENHSGLYIAADWTKNLIINGIINDPDLMTSTAVSLGLGLVTGGVGVAASLAYHSSKSIGKTRGYIKVINKLRAGQSYLPETIAPHLLRKYVWKEGYESASFWGKAGRNF